MNAQRYESQKSLSQYLLFHYGSERDQMPFPFGPLNSLQFPVRAVRECLDVQALAPHATALELGCAVGRSSFELARFCERVVAVDSSQAFIAAAKQIQQKGEMPYTLLEEGIQQAERLAQRPLDIDAERIEFLCHDVLEKMHELDPCHVVLAANLLCRLKEPRLFLSSLRHLVLKGGQLILISPYSWLEEFTPRSEWIQGAVIKSIQDLLEDSFSLIRTQDLPFILRDHFRKYEWGVSQASIWRRL